MAFQPAQHVRRRRPAIDQVAQHVDRVAAGRKRDLFEEAAQGGVAALHIANQIKCHGVRFSQPPLMEVLLIALLTVLNGVFAMSELGLASSRKARLQAMAEEGDHGAATALKLMEQPTRFLSTVQVGMTSIMILNNII